MPDARPFPRRFFSALVHPWTWRMAWRDSRAQRGRLLIFSLAIVSGISALTAIHTLKASVQQGIDTQAKALLGSDLQISSRQPVKPEELERLSARATRTSRETTFPSMLHFLSNGGTRMVQVRGIEGGYPFYGEVKTTPADGWQRLQSEPGILLEPALLDQFGAKAEDEVELGTLKLRILGAVDQPAPRGSRFSGFAPEAYVRLGDVEKSGLLGANSMSMHQLHLEIAGGPVDDELKDQIRADFPDTSWRLETPEDRRENLGNALEHFQRFLGILALAALVLGAIGVAGAVHAHVARRIPTVAVLRCLGCPAQTAFAVFFVQSAVLGLVGAILGAALGVTLQQAVLATFRDSMPIQLETTLDWAVVARTTAAGFAVCCGFALLPLLKVLGISPAATLRAGSDQEVRSWRVVPVYALLAGLLVLLALSNDPSWKRSLALVGGLAVAFAVLALVAKVLIFTARRIVRPSWPYLLRQGLSNLHRPRNQTLLFLLSLGLGTFLLVTVVLTGSLIRQRLNLTRHAESPNLYLIDVQPDQVAGVRSAVEGKGLPVLESAPMVTMRVSAIRGTPVRDLRDVPRWIVRREFRSTYRPNMNATETIVAGEWRDSLPADGGPVPLSLEEDIAEDMRVSIGDRITLDVQGVPVEAEVTSLRKVDWSRFNLNFFMVFPPGVLEDAPGFHVVTTRTPSSEVSGELQRSLVGEFGNVTAIDLTLILETVFSILSKISTVVSVLAGFTVLAGIPIVVGTLLNGRDVRLRESVLLRTLGASARQVRIILVVEYAALGLLSALTGVILAVLGNAALAKFVFEGDPWPDPVVVLGALGAAVVVSVGGGMWIGRGVCHHPPLGILRGGA